MFPGFCASLYPQCALSHDLVRRFTGTTQVYVVRGGVLRGIPSQHTFIAMGFDFGDIKVLNAESRAGYSIGDMMPEM
jgi:hypothetical protein